VDFRLIAATNRDLRALVAEGKFREDLFFRLDVVDINLPPLRARGEDIPLLCNHFIREFAAKNNKTVEMPPTPDALNLLTAYAWPGNVRELRNTVEKMVVLARSPRLTARDVPANIREAVGAGGQAPARPLGAVCAGDSLADAERTMIRAAMKRTGNNVTRAARELGISRRTLHRKLKQYQQEDDQAAPANGAGAPAPGAG
jgi:DNA-binding NtrC family response regulator